MTAPSRADAERYARHLALAEIGPRGQQRLKASRVLIVGIGALGSPAALYLAGAGIGTLGLADDDSVRLSNLQRQIVHDTDAIGVKKVAAAADRLQRLRPDLQIDRLPVRIDAGNAMEILARYDVIVDGTDSFAARYLLSDAAFLLGKPLVHGSIFRVEGQVTVFTPGRGCYRCLYPDPPPASLIHETAESGVLAPLPGIIGTIQAAETIKVITGRGESLVGRVLLHDTLAMTFREVRYRRNPACPVCGDAPVIRGLVDYEAFAGAAR